MTPIFDIKELIALMRKGASEEAIPHLEHITQKLPTHVAAHALLAQAYTNEHRFEEAKAAWQNALFLMPNSPSIQKGFRRVLKELAKQQFAKINRQIAQPPEEHHDPPLSEEIEQADPFLSSNNHEHQQHAQDDQTAPQTAALLHDEQHLNGLEQTSSVLEELPDALEELPDALEETPDALEETPDALEETPDALEETPDALEETPDALEETPDALEETPDALEETLDALEEMPDALEETPDALEETPDALEETLDALEEMPSTLQDPPSMMINPSSHHEATPVEIEALTPGDSPGEERDDQELDKQDESDEQDQISLPVITIPTPTSTNSSPSVSAKTPLPPILAPLVDEMEEGYEDQELDHLIAELESARIVPKPDHEHIESPLLEENIEDMVSETLARIFEGQKQHAKAADMYEKLAAIHPERSKKFEAKAAELRALMSGTSDQIHETNSDES